MTLTAARRRAVALGCSRGAGPVLPRRAGGGPGRPGADPRDSAPSGLEVSLVGNRVTPAWEAPVSDASQPAPAYCDETDPSWQNADPTPGITHVKTLELSNVTHDSVTLEWTAPTGDAPLGYVIVRSKDGGTNEFAECAIDPSWTSHTDSGLEPETEYTYWVSVIRPTGLSMLSQAATATTTTLREPPPAVPVCERTPQVLDAILGALPSVTDCASVTEAHLGSIEFSLDLTNEGTTDLKAGDFGGLTNLGHLGLTLNDLRELPDGVFDSLQSLTYLHLAGNDLEKLPDGVFDNLTKLDWLDLGYNELERLPHGVFDKLTNLTVLGLHGNGLDALPHGVFDSLSNLRRLYLDENGLDALPDGVFDNLSNLEYLHLHDNDLQALPDGVFDGASDLEILYLHGNPGTPFVFGAELEQPDDQTAVVRVALGAPFDMDVTLSAQGATLSTDTVTVDAGSIISDAVDVTPDGNGPVTIDITSVAFVFGLNDEVRGIRARRIGPPTPPTDDTAPELSSSACGHSSCTLTFNENLDGTARPPTSAFALTADSATVTLSAVEVMDMDSVVTLTIASPPVRSGQTVSLTYTDPTAGNDAAAIQDASGNDAATFTATLTNYSPYSLPGTPTGLSAAADGPTRIDLSWTAPADDGHDSDDLDLTYTVEVSSDSGSSWSVKVAGHADTKYSHTGLTADSTRHYRVSAVNIVGTSTVPSNAASATTGQATGPGPGGGSGGSGGPQPAGVVVEIVGPGFGAPGAETTFTAVVDGEGSSALSWRVTGPGGFLRCRRGRGVRLHAACRRRLHGDGDLRRRRWGDL